MRFENKLSPSVTSPGRGTFVTLNPGGVLLEWTVETIPCEMPSQAWPSKQNQTRNSTKPSRPSTGCPVSHATPAATRHDSVHSIDHSPNFTYTQNTEIDSTEGGGGLTALSPSCMDVNLKPGFFFLSRSLHAVFLNCPSDCKHKNKPRRESRLGAYLRK